MLKSGKILILLVLGILTAGVCNTASAQSLHSAWEMSDSVRVYFKQGVYKLDLDFEENKKNLDVFVSRVKMLQESQRFAVKGVRVFSGASPEGSVAHNRMLSDKRADAILNYLHNYMELPDSLVHINSPGVDWEGLDRLVAASDVEYRDTVLHIIRNTPIWIYKKGVIVDGRKRQLMMLESGRIWWDMYDRFFPQLRSSALKVVVYLERLPSDTALLENLDLPVRASAKVGQPEFKLKTEVVVPEERKPFYMNFRTNMLYDVAFVPNLGVEFYLGRNWSIAGNWMYAWWHNDTRHNYWRTYGGDLEVRKWLGRRAAEKPLTGHHLGLYGQIVTYDFELGGRGYLGDRWSYGAGLAYGYSVPVGRRFNIDFSLGLGYLGGEYKEYLPIDDCYVWQVTKQRHWFGPTKAEIMLIWQIGRGNYNKMKGGK